MTVLDTDGSLTCHVFDGEQVGTQVSGAGAPLLSMRGITKRFGAVEALVGVDFEVHAHEVVALVGDNGAGKSTLAKMVAGVLAPDAGFIEIAGQPVTIPSPAAAQDLGVATVFQDLALCENLDVTANLFLGRELHGAVSRDDAEMERVTREVLDKLASRIPSVRTPLSHLSAGQRQTVAIARTLIGAPQIVVLDEPTAALSVVQTAEVLMHIERLRDLGLGVILISHNMTDVRAVSDRIEVLRHGRNNGSYDASSTSFEEIIAAITGATHAERGLRSVSLRGARERQVGAPERCGPASWSAEDDGAHAVEQHPVLGMPAHRAGERSTLHVLAQPHHVLHRAAVVHPFDVLLDDRPLVEVGGDVVRGGADELDAAGVGLRVGPGALERRQERVVDVDDPAGQAPAQIVGQHLHVPGEDDELHVELVHQCGEPRLGRRLGRGAHRHVVEADAVELGERAQVVVVGHHGDDVDGQALRALPERQVVQAVRRAGHHDEGAHGPAGELERPAHVEPGGQRGDGLAQLVVRGGGVHLHPHEEPAGQRVTELLGLGDVAAVLGQQARDGGHDAGPVGAGQRQDPGGRVAARVDEGHEARE